MLTRIIKNCFKLFDFFEQKQKIEFYLIILFLVLYSLLEIISIGLLIPFVTIILSPEKIFEFQLFKNLFPLENINIINLQLFFTLIFILGIIVANILESYFVQNWKYSKIFQ